MERTITAIFKRNNAEVESNMTHTKISHIDVMASRGFTLIGMKYGYTDKPNYCVDCGKYIENTTWVKRCTPCYTLNK